MTDYSQLLQKTAVHFAKTGPAIYHSHHDMIRFWERAVRRAELPLRLTQGFNPHPRIVFPHALGLGIASRHEEVELELCRTVPLQEVVAKVTAAAGDTLEILGAENLPPVKKSRLLTSSTYLVTGWTEEAEKGLSGVAQEILAQTEMVVERGAPGKRRTMDIRPYLKDIRYLPAEKALYIHLAHTTTGAARPDEIAKAAAEATQSDFHALAIEKIAMTLE